MDATTPNDRAALLELARDPEQTPFDYIVVGSGAGGGPLAARLALGGRRVLVLEAGVDPAQDAHGAAPRDVYAVPAFHAAATEDPQTSWMFSVRHYDDNARQARDSKYDATRDPGIGIRKGGIQYPRAAAIGGCTAHHAMIIVRPNDADWDRIAESTNDASWRSEHMQGYFTKIERSLGYGVYDSFLRRVFGGTFALVRRALTLVEPRRQLDTGGHGTQGWQPTNFIDPLVIARIVRGDRALLHILWRVILATVTTTGQRARLLGDALRTQPLRSLDPNVRSPRLPARAHLSLISIGTENGRRHGLREHLLRVQQQQPQHLVIETGTHVTQLLFKAERHGPPKAIGVELLRGPHLYRASPRSPREGPPAPTEKLFAREEIIVCGGAFNSPQLLMLSGIGDRTELLLHGITGLRGSAGVDVAPAVHLPGVGRHLQDRYEVSIISQAGAPFSTLDGATFRPGPPDDKVLAQWREDGSGLYATNGGALALMMSSRANQDVRRDPDLFIFGAPAAFRGYYWNWSRELLMATKGAGAEQRDLWTWVILKAYTDNDHGRVRLRSRDPLEPPHIDFHSFPATVGAQKDVEALAEAVVRMREINAKVPGLVREVQPGPAVPPGRSPQLDDWIRNEAWGHHACGTCRMGAARWTANPAGLPPADAQAVLSSDFRVHGVQGLRVVDTSVFPRIPGYFIATPTFMIGEKAADLLLADRPEYPRALASEEAEAVRLRRRAATPGGPPAPPPPPPGGVPPPGGAPPGAGASKATAAASLPDDTVGLALSGGGIRSATFCLGVLQALAQRGRLRGVDIVSSVSGGAFAASFLGRLYTRLSDDVRDKPARVEAILGNGMASELWWLRRHANYIDSGSRADLQSNIAIVLRNLGFVHVWLGLLFFALFGLAHWAADAAPWLSAVPPLDLFGIRLSPWWWLPPALALFGAVPLAAGYWFVLRDPREGGGREVVPLLLWMVLVACAVSGLGVPQLRPWALLGLALGLLAWAAQAIAGWRVPAPEPEMAQRESAGRSGARTALPPSTVVRNRLSRALGSTLFGLAVALAWVVLDSLARAGAASGRQWPMWSMAGIVPLLPVLRALAMRLIGGTGAVASTPFDGPIRHVLVATLTFGLVFVLLLYVDMTVHWTFVQPQVGLWLTGAALAASLVIGRAVAYLNLSSLQQAYGQKLVRTFLGASNPARVYPPGVDVAVPVHVPDASDDVEFDAYAPHAHGGPLHLIGVCVNDTVDGSSGRQLRDDKGLPMCVGPAGLSVGLRHHALWTRDAGTPARFAPLMPVRTAPNPQQFHVLARSDGAPVRVERLRLGQWVAISGAAVSTGLGRSTSLVRSVLLGLCNLRVGYWWNSGIPADKRPGRFPPDLWERLKTLPQWLFPLQMSLLDEWRARFPGASEALWHLSDGGHFDNTGLYELLRRRVRFMIAVDATQDPDYRFDDLAVLTRQARVDFGATIEWDGTRLAAVPPAFADWLNPEGIARDLSSLKRDAGRCATLARVTYADDPSRICWLLLIKPCVGMQLPADTRYHATAYPSFPQDSTVDQFFDDAQWEAYRVLGMRAGETVIG